jgi:peptidyl-prolyl cis-trans isomerase D
MAKSGVKSFSNTLVWVILILVFVGLGGYGAVNFSRGVTTIGQVGDKDVDVRRYARMLEEQLASMSQQFGQPIPMEIAKAMGVDRQVLDELIRQVASENEAAKLGLSIGDERVAKALLAAPYLVDPAGKFDRSAYDQFLRRSGLSAADFEAEIRAQGAREMLEFAVAGGVKMPATYADTLHNFAAERRSFTWAKVTATNLDTPVAQPTEAEITAWYEANPEAFTAPEIKRIEYVALKPEDVAKTIPEDEAALRAEYDRRIADYVIPERRLVERLIFATRADADAALAEVTAGTKTFDDLVAARGLALDDIDLGEQTKDELGAAGEAVFALTEPGLAGPVDIDLGAAIFRMNGILKAQETTFDSVRSDLNVEVSMERARVQINGQVELISDLLAQGLTLTEIAAEANMEHGQIDYVAGLSEGMAAYEGFAGAAAAVTTEAFPKVELLEDGGIFAMVLKEVVPPTLKPLDEVRADVIAAWTLDATRKAVDAKADALIARAKAGESGEALGVMFIAEDPMTRDGFVEGLPEGALPALFALTDKDTIRVSAPGGEPLAVLLTLTDILPPDLEDTGVAERKTRLSDASTSQLQFDILQTWSRAVEDVAGVRIDQATIDALLTNYN